MRKRGPTTGMRVRKERSRSAVEADWQTAGDQPGTGLTGGVPPIQLELLEGGAPLELL